MTNVSVASCPSKRTPSGGVIAACSIRTQEEEQLSSSLALATHVVSRAIGRFGVRALSVCMCVCARAYHFGAIECARVVGLRRPAAALRCHCHLLVFVCIHRGGSSPVAVTRWLVTGRLYLNHLLSVVRQRPE